MGSSPTLGTNVEVNSMLVEQVWTGNSYRNFNYLIACEETGGSHSPVTEPVRLTVNRRYSSSVGEDAIPKGDSPMPSTETSAN